jgi:hypothetical protein
MTIYADFNNRDADGYLRLGNVGTIEGLSSSAVVLEEGLKLVVSDGDLTATIVVRMPGQESTWRGEIVGEIVEGRIGGRDPDAMTDG